MRLAPGSRLGPYEILLAVGTGGMGEVYRARDTRLDRVVAVKVLPVGAMSPQALERFEREARAIAALNHPGICTIHDVGVAPPEATATSSPAPVHFLVMEFLEGETLQQRLSRGPLDVPTLVETGLTLADALAAAHGRGIVHRDVKPANIVLTAHGPKLLDFGLARVTDHPVALDLTQKPTLAAPGPLTEPGAAVGTLAYMSPEQLRGEPLDARTDVFSLGLVLYEMATGRHPFPGGTGAVTSAAILHETPAPPRRLRPDLPARLEHVILAALEKDREVRVQTAADLRAELMRLKRELASSRESARVIDLAAAAGMASSAAHAAPAEGSSDAQLLAGVMRRHRRVLAALAALLVVVVLAALYAMGRRVSGTPDDDERSFTIADLRVEPLTSSDNAFGAAITPDGQYIVYVQRDRNGDSLRLRRIATPSNVEIVAAEAGVSIMGATVTPDGEFVDFVRRVDQRDELWRIPLLGGVRPRRLLTDVSSLIDWSPDGERMAFLRSSPGSTSLVVADRDARAEHVVATRTGQDIFWAWGVSPPERIWRPAWSPNGRTIAVLGARFGEEPAGHVVFVDASSGAERVVETSPPLLGTALAWLDSRTLLMTRSDSVTNPMQVWRMSYREGTFARVTNDVNTYSGVSLTADATAMATTLTEYKVGIWVSMDSGLARWDAAVSPRPSSPVAYGLQWGGDDLVFTDGVGASLALARWQRASRSIEPIGPLLGNPTVTIDGSSIVFFNYDGGGIWKSDAEGRNRVRLASVRSLGTGWTLIPNGRALVFFDSATQTLSMGVVDDSGLRDMSTLSDRAAGRPAVSPDGHRVVFASVDDSLRPTTTVCDLPRCASPQPLPPLMQPRWTPDGHGITYVDAETQANLWVHPLDGSPSRQVTAFPDDGRTIADYSWSADGRLAVARAELSQNIVLFRGMRRSSP